MEALIVALILALWADVRVQIHEIRKRLENHLEKGELSHAR